MQNESMKIDITSLPDEVAGPLRQYLIDLVMSTRGQNVLDVSFTGITIENFSIVTEFSKYASMPSLSQGAPTPGASDWHEADATGALDEPLVFSQGDVLDDDYDPQF